MKNRSIYSWFFSFTWEFVLELVILILVSKGGANGFLAFALSLCMFFNAVWIQLVSYCLLTNRKKPWDWLCFSSKQKTFDMFQSASKECLQNEDYDSAHVKRYLCILMFATAALYIFSLFFLFS